MNILENQGVLQVVIDEYNKHKLPHLIMIKNQVEGGSQLYDEQITFMKGLYMEINGYGLCITGNGLCIENSVELKTIYISFASLFHSIMDLAIENERRLNLDIVEQ